MTTVAKRNVTEMETYTGRYVDLLNPQPDQISLADIAVGLSNCCRFGAQVSRFYSVAEHSVRCASHFDESASDLALHTLFHDAHEAYTGDITAPMKHTLELAAPGALRALQDRLDTAIAEHFGLDAGQLKAGVVKLVDDAVMFREAAGLKYSHGIGEHWGNDTYYEPLTDYGWPPAEAERRFIQTYQRLTCAERS